jgi:hypothetical protein
VVATSRKRLVFGVAEVAKLWSDGQFLFSHIENTLMFQESQPYHPKLLLKLGKRFEIYLQAFTSGLYRRSTGAPCLRT